MHPNPGTRNSLSYFPNSQNLCYSYSENIRGKCLFISWMLSTPFVLLNPFCQTTAHSFYRVYSKLWLHSTVSNILPLQFFLPQANAYERVNRSVIAAIRAYITGNRLNWGQHISAIQHALRTTVHPSTGFTPHYLVFGEHPLQHGSGLELLRKLSRLLLADLEVYSPPEFRDLVQALVICNLHQIPSKSHPSKVT